MSATLTTYDDVLKDYYTEQRLNALFEQDAPFLSRVSKAEDFPGETMPIPVRYGISQGINSQYTTARTLSQNTSALFDRFNSVRYKKYLIARIDGETHHATKSNEGAFVDALTSEIDSVLLGGKRRAAFEAYRDGWGSCGVINSDTGSATTTVTLANIDDVTIWEKGMTVVFSSSLNAATLRGSGAALTVSAVNRATGVITFTAAVTTITSVTTGDYMFIEGERQNSATPARRVTPGLAAWLPQTSPATDDDFLGCNRSLDPTRLAGQRVSATTVPLEEALISGNIQVGREGGRISDYYMSFTSWARLEKGLGTRARYTDEKSRTAPDVGFTALEVSGPGGKVKCFADAFSIGNKVFGLDMKSWKYRFIDKMFMNRGEGTDKLTMLRVVDEDSFESAWAHYGALQCDAPGHNVTIQVAS